MLDNSHSAFSPPNTNLTLWRYMDLTKLLSLLENRRLFFARADMFDDPYEGTWSKAGVKKLRAQVAAGTIPLTSATVDGLLASSESMRQKTFISCWFASEHESAAMWELYASSKGVAIMSDHDSLASAIQAAPITGSTTMISYVDYDKTPISFKNTFFPFTHKRLSFEHENELRAIISSDGGINRQHIQADATSVVIDINPEYLIKKIFVSPRADQWFSELVEQIVNRYSLPIPVVKSNLYDRPIY
ncbi:MAG: hypothetical protein AAF730_05340 [Bacteroidota bacterium]